ncbi:MAG: hypothetical protein NTZ17_03415 [Phycisphaerae bacterium]|nr:hypothetical protein [Phycisphaerae bacterium]
MNAAVAPLSDIDVALRINRDRAGSLQLPVTAAGLCPPLRKEPSLRRVFLNPDIIGAILASSEIDRQYEDVPFFVESQIDGHLDLVCVRRLPLQHPKELPVHSKLLDAILFPLAKIRVENIHHSRAVHLDTAYRIELPFSLAGASPLGDEPAVGVELLDLVVAAVADIDIA